MKTKIHLPFYWVIVGIRVILAGCTIGAFLTPSPVVALVDSLPDLVITNVTLFPANIVVGQSIAVNITVQNQGGDNYDFITNPPDKVYRDVYVDTPPNFAQNSCPPGSDFNNTADTIPAGLSDTKTIMVNNPGAGVHQLYIYVDVNCAVAESNDGNNSYGPLPITIVVGTQLPDPWVGGVRIESDRSIVAVGRPHVGSEVLTYDNFSSGSLTAYIPMLFKGAFGGSYNSALYIQNMDAANPAGISIKYYDSSGVLICTKGDTILPLSSKGYWIPSVTCDSGTLPDGWVGGVVVTSDQPIATVGRPHVGSEVMSYNGFAAGSNSAYIPMLFKGAFGGSYNAAFYIQNVNDSNTANIIIQYFDSSGVLNCTKSDTISPLASKGYWVPSVACDSGSLPAGWVGGVKITSDQPIVAIGRPHIDSQVTTYAGFPFGSLDSYVPMLFKDAFGGSYDSALYIQNTHATNTAHITIKYYNSSGTLNCIKEADISPLASTGYWIPSATCDAGFIPPGWVGGVAISSDQPIVAVGRPHIGLQVTTYNGFASGSLSVSLPMLFKGAFGGSYNSAFYLQNVDPVNPAVITIRFYDSSGNLNCTRYDTIPALASLGYWVPSLSCNE